MKNLKLCTDYSDEERFVDYEKNVQWAQKLIDEVDAIRLALPPYNSTQLKQLISILLDNAIRHSKPDGEVRLSLTKDHGIAEISVINKGDEIPAEHRERIFERFYRVDTARNGEDKHYGLGLAIAKAIVDAHHGHIEVNCYNGLVEFHVRMPMK